jgi:putative transposase
LGMKQIITCWSNPKGNADTDRLIRTLKEDLVWP